MPLDPHLAAVLKKFDDAGRQPAHLVPVAMSRMGYLMMTRGTLTPQQVIEVANVQDTELGVDDRLIKARIYRPEGKGSFPTVVFFHGGGFVLGDLETHDNMCRELCRTSRVVVLAVDYRLAPEHPFPAAFNDAMAATKWALANTVKLGGSNVVAVAGDSAGGNLAAVVSQQLRDEGIKLAAQFLIYPALDGSKASYPSREANAKGYFLELETFNWFEKQYAGMLDANADPRITPIHASNLAGLPPALIVTAEFDPLCDEGLAYGQVLAAAGVHTEVLPCEGMIHAFFDMGRWSPRAQTHITECLNRFGQLLRTPIGHVSQTPGLEPAQGL